MNTNRLFSLWAVFALLISLCACGVSQEPASTTSQTAADTQLTTEHTLPFEETVAPTIEMTVPTTEPVQAVTTPVEAETPLETSMPTETAPETKPTEPANQPTATEPKETAPAATEPKETQPPATEPQPTMPKENPYINEAGQTVYYCSGGTIIAGMDENGEAFMYETPPRTFVFDVTPATIRASDWNSMDKETQIAFERCFPTSKMSPEEYHNFLKATKFNDYDCGYEGHACRNESDHKRLMEDLATPCRYCGQTNCVSWLTLDPTDLYTRYTATACPQYDEHKDPNYYCQTCGKPKYGPNSQSCSRYLADTNCHTCGEPVTAWACHTCAFDEDIYDEYEKEFIAPRPTTLTPTTP